MCNSGLVAAVAVLCAGAAASAQPFITVTERTRFIEGVSRTTFPDGTTITNGPIRMEGPMSPDPAMPPFFPINLDVPGAINVHGMQEGGFNGNDSIELHAWDINLSGDAPPDGSASADIANTFSYTFTVSQPLDYILQGLLHTTPTMGMGYTRARFKLEGPGVLIDEITPDGGDNIIMLDGRQGRLNPGTYTFLVEVTAHLVDFGPGPVNAHADGPMAAIRVMPAQVPPCGTADFDGDGDVGTDADIEAFFACLAGNCCGTCFSGGADFNGDGDVGTDADIEAFFRVLAGGNC